MKVGVPKEVKNREYRVALTPIGVLGELVSMGTLLTFVIVCAGIVIGRKTGRCRITWYNMRERNHHIRGVNRNTW